MVNKRMCPKCQSKEVITDWSIANIAREFANPSFKCNNCGFVGTFFPEIDEKQIKNIKSKIN